MHPVVRALALAAALTCSTPVLAQDLSVGAAKALTARIEAGVAACDVDSIVEDFAELATFTVNKNENGGLRTLRLNKSQYGQLLSLLCGQLEAYEYHRSNEKVSIEGAQAVVTADITEKFVVDGRPIEAKSRERAVLRSMDGKLMLTQLVSNQIL